jgi:starch-binding outer membrane protein, SusD/RagB family
MKTSIKYMGLILLMLVLLLGSCKKDFLERYPLDSMSDATFFSSPNDLKVFVNGFYQILPRYHFQSQYDGPNNANLDANSDILLSISPSGTLMQRGSSGQAPATNSTWTSNYTWIRQINYFIANYPRVKPRSAASNQYVGEGYFFRAMVYYNMLVNFGDVPIITQVLSTDSTNLYKARDPRYEVAKFIIKDLDSAIVNTGWKGAATVGVGRVTKEAAMVLKARVALFEGTWERYHGIKNTAFKVNGKNGDDLIKLIEPVMSDLIAHQGTAIFTTGGPYNEAYNQLFSQQDASKTAGVFLYRVYDATQIVGHNFFDDVVDVSVGLSKNLLEAYLDKDGNPQSLTTRTIDIKNLTNLATNLDPRFRQTVWTPDRGPQNKLQGLGTQAYPSRYPNINNALTSNYPPGGLRVWKGAILDANEWRNGSTDDVLIRYEEGLLALAEAKAILGTITQADLDKTVNLIRSRVGMASLNLAKVNSWKINYLRSKSFEPTETNIVNEIRRERLVELVLEGHRVNDLKRWAVYDDAVNGWKPVGAHYQEYFDYFNNTTLLIADGFNAVTAAKLKLTLGTNFSVDADGFINPYYTNSDFKATGTGFFIEAGRAYLSAVPKNEINLYLEKAQVVLTQNPGWF